MRIKETTISTGNDNTGISITINYCSVQSYHTFPLLKCPSSITGFKTIWGLAVSIRTAQWLTSRCWTNH